MEINIDIEIYPNPFNNQIFIKAKGFNSDLFLRMFDINGKMLIEKKISSEIVGLDFVFSKGIYNAVIVDKNGKVITSKKLLKE